jgi:hypothetical protein
MKVNVKHNGRTVPVDVAADATFGALRVELQKHFGVAPSRQRLLFAKKPSANRGAPDDLLAAGGVNEGIHIMLVGAAVVAIPPDKPQGGAAPPPDLVDPSTLVAVTNEDEGGTVSCTYPLGYVCQASFVCRTCIDDGRAPPEHMLCEGCSVVCHESLGHKVEMWGKRLYTRCDCGTACLKGRAPGGTGLEQPLVCKFLADENSGANPSKRLAANVHNVYPENDAGKWCACRWTNDVGAEGPAAAASPARRASTTVAKAAPAGDSGAEDDDEEDDEGSGDCCVLCGSCFWTAHLTALKVEPVFHVSCYGTAKGEFLYFHCNTCRTDCCLSCRLHCHFDHDVDAAPSLFTSGENTTGEGDVFACGCHGMCAITEAVAPDVAAACYAKVEATAFFDGPSKITEGTTVRQDLTSDHCVMTVCGGCMQRYPWLHEDVAAIRGCRGGAALPPTAAVTQAQSCSACDRGEQGLARPANAYPHHGLIIPNNFFNDVLCQCDLCRDLFDDAIAGCGGLETVNDCFVPTGCACSNCGENCDENDTFVCTTCEVAAQEGIPNSYQLCGACHARRRAEPGAVNHPAAHDFAESSFDNMWALFGASLALQVDADTRRWMTENWEDAQQLFFDYVRGNVRATKRLRDDDGSNRSNRSNRSSGTQ